MNNSDIILIAIGLAMDCFTVSIAAGVCKQKFQAAPMLCMALCFGLFQALMPLIGWGGVLYFSDFFQQIDHWIAFALLLFLGGRMIKEGLEDEEEERDFGNLSVMTILTLSIATSIDALAVGISFSCLGYHTINSMAFPLSVIGIASLAFSLLGLCLGIVFGRSISKRIRPEFLGGIILILLGCKILAEHLDFL